MNLNLIGPFNSLGYGRCVANLLKALHNLGNDVAFFPIGQPQPENQLEVELLQRTIKKQEFYDWNAPSLRIWHQFDLSQHVGKGKRIGFPIFELNKFTDREIHHLNSQDMLFTCSEWGKQIIKDNNINVTTKVIPLGIDPTIFYPFKLDRKIPEISSEIGINENTTIFINIGKWTINKGHDVLIDAFNSAFEESDNILFIMLCQNPFLNERQEKEWIDLYKNSKLGKKIMLHARVRTQSELADIMGLSDCGVFLSRGEGWNLEALELLSMGKHLIVTNYSGQTEFCNTNNSNLVDIDELEEAYDGIWFHGQGEWAKIGERQIEQAVEYMRKIHKLKQSGQLNINQKGIEMRHIFTWENSVSRLVSYLS